MIWVSFTHVCFMAVYYVHFVLTRSRVMKLQTNMIPRRHAFGWWSYTCLWGYYGREQFHYSTAAIPLYVKNRRQYPPSRECMCSYPNLVFFLAVDSDWKLAFFMTTFYVLVSRYFNVFQSHCPIFKSVWRKILSFHFKKFSLESHPFI